MFEEIIKAIGEFDTIIIHRHTKPDGDAIGSQTGLMHILSDAFPEKKIYMTGDRAGRFSFMDDSTMDELPSDVFKSALSIILDCGGSNMVSDDRYTMAAKSARIDHHVYSGSFTDIEVIDSERESCCGLIASFAAEQHLPLSPAAAKALFTGMVTDSGRFRYDSTTANTLRTAALLLEKGIDLNEIYRNLYADDFEYKRLKAEFILKIRFTPHNVAYIYTTRQELEALGQDTFSISRGMVNTMADIKGVSIWVNFTETEDGVLCELRSGDKSVVHIAKRHGGGGHDKACGATLSSKAEAMEMLGELDEIMQEKI